MYNHDVLLFLLHLFWLPLSKSSKLGWELHKLRVRKNGCLCVKRARNKLEREKERCFPAKNAISRGIKRWEKKEVWALSQNGWEFSLFWYEHRLSRIMGYFAKQLSELPQIKFTLTAKLSFLIINQQQKLFHNYVLNASLPGIVKRRHLRRAQ